MLIRSQDKTELIKFENMHIGLDRQVKGGIIAFPYSANGKGILIGQYSTEEKAMKVLDMIQQAYECSLYCDYVFDSSAQVQRPYIFVNNTVFQMPQESEVE